MHHDNITPTLQGLLRSGWEDATAPADVRTYAELWSSFSKSARAIAESDAEASSVLAFLARICSLQLSDIGLANPYGVMISTVEGRTMRVEDFRPEEVIFLRDVVEHVDDFRVRARAADLLWLLGDRSERAKYAAVAIEDYQDWPLDASHRNTDVWTAWSRAIDVSKRLGHAYRAQTASIENRLIERFLEAEDGTELLQIGDVLLTQRLALDASGLIARKLEATALALASQEALKRRYLVLAHSWYLRARDARNAAVMVRQQVESWIREAQSRRTGENTSNLVAASFYESALQVYRQLSRGDRQSFGIESLGDELADLVRSCGQLGLDEMEAISTDPVNLADAARHAVDGVAGKDVAEAMFEFVSLAGLRSFREDKDFAEQLVRDSPLGGLFPNVHYSRDGRVVHRTDNRTTVYGVQARVWGQMTQAFELNIRLLVQGVLGPAFNQLSNEHRLTLRDFQNVALGSSIVPRDRALTVALGLMHGYNGDFTSAMYVLTPQVENLVRCALREAGVSTSTIDATGVENEIGLTGLMQMDEAVVVFGEDLAYEIRALYCGPLGPNIRNVAAHGLLDDAFHHTAEVFYAWWFVLRLLYAPYWNRRRENNDTSTITPENQDPSWQDQPSGESHAEEE